MTARTGQIAADVAWARPPSIPADLILNYSGPAFAGLDQIRAWAKPFVLGFESTTTRAYAGYDAGALDAQQLVSVARTIPGYLAARCGFWFCAADEPSTPAWALPGITDYGRAMRDVTTSAVGARVPLDPYGNPAARRAAAAGCGDPLNPWGIGTWGEGEGGGANQPPAASDECALIQSGNTPGPAEGTDLNWLYRPLEAFAAWGGPAATPTPNPRKRGADMELLISPTRALSHTAGVLDAEFPDPTVRVNGIPTSATLFLAANPGVQVSHVGEATYDRVLTKITTAPVNVDVKSLASALASLLPVPAGSLTEAQVEDALRVVLHGA